MNRKDKLKELGHNDYDEYLLSRHWKKTRKRKLKTTGHECEKCGAKQKLHIHHLTYENLGHEPLGDLMVLCQGCHAEAHKQEWKKKSYKQTQHVLSSEERDALRERNREIKAQNKRNVGRRTERPLDPSSPFRYLAKGP